LLQVEKENLKELIIEHKDRFLARRDLLPRDIQQEIGRYLPQREIIILTGVRRCGKTSLLRLICDDLLNKKAVPARNILYLNFEDERFLPFTAQNFDLLYETFMEVENPQGRLFLFLDEIQNIKGWEKWLNRLYEFEDVKAFVTGSNATMLSSEISTALTGRNRQVVVWPFSFREVLRLRGCIVDDRSLYRRNSRTEIKRLFREYTELGGFPEVLKTGDTTLLTQYYRDILYRDVIARHAIKKIREIKELALYLAANPATVLSYKNIQGMIGVRSINTVKNYLAALNDVYLFFFTDMFDYSVKRQIYNPSKLYAVDTAMINSVSFRFSRNIGHLHENIVFLELKRRTREIYYGKTRKGKEVDFLIKEGLHVVEAIQVSSSLSDAKTRKRELEALTEIREELKKGGQEAATRDLTMTVITDDEENIVETENGHIRIIPLWKWLLG
jgi:predicted AAA+ superfamily ATPase